MKLHCIVFKSQVIANDNIRPIYVAVCLDHFIAAQGETKDHASSVLEVLIFQTIKIHDIYGYEPAPIEYQRWRDEVEKGHEISHYELDTDVFDSKYRIVLAPNPGAELPGAEGASHGK